MKYEIGSGARLIQVHSPVTVRKNVMEHAILPHLRKDGALLAIKHEMHAVSLAALRVRREALLARFNTLANINDSFA